MTPAETIDYLRGTASNLKYLCTASKAEDGDLNLDGEEAQEMVDSLRAAADRVEQLQQQVAAYEDWSKTLSGYIVATHKQGAVDDAAVAILDGYHVGLTPVAGPSSGGENTLAAALRLLKLAKDRGAFDPPGGK